MARLLHVQSLARALPQVRSPISWRSRCFVRCSASTAPSVAVPKAAIMIIGDEVLSGSIADINTPWLAKLLFNRGVDLVRVETVPDIASDIAETARRLKERVGSGGFVFTSGGIGPTHDDVTYQALASAFGTTLALHQPTVERMQKHYDARGVELNEARLRMATLPVGAEVLFTDGLWVPLVNIHDVYILPGIPRLFQQMIEAHAERFKGAAAKKEILYSHMGEGDLAVILRDIAKQHPKVHIGSYPNADLGRQTYKVKLQFESRDADALAEAVSAAENQLETFRL